MGSGRPWQNTIALFETFADFEPFGGVEAEVCRAAFLDYCVLGGMPAVVESFVRKGTFAGTLGIQKKLVADYREDRG